eukprot:257250-Chlamydomonas_euryale.AAC.1
MEQGFEQVGNIMLGGLHAGVGDRGWGLPRNGGARSGWVACTQGRGEIRLVGYDAVAGKTRLG